MPVAAAFPFIEVRIDTSGLTPVAQRQPGVIAVVGNTPAGAPGGTASVNTPLRVDTLDQAADLFAELDVSGNVVPTALFSSLRLALLQDPKPSKIYGVRVDAGDYAAALSGLEAADDVTLVSLANETSVGTASGGVGPATDLTALKEHVENMSAQGQKRIGVAMIDPATAKSPTYVQTVAGAVATLKSSTSRMVMMAARGATEDVATATMAAVGGYPPHISMVLKKVRGTSIPLAEQYSPSEITGLSEEDINPIIDPALIVGESLHFAEGRCFTTDASLLHIDIVRVLDDLEFRLRAGLVGVTGDARITKAGMTRVKARTEGILGVQRRRHVIARFAVDIPVLNILNTPESIWSPADSNEVVTARANRTVDMFVSVTYGPAVHRLKVTLAPTF